MKTLTYSDIKSFGPCYDPIKYIPETFSGTLVEILKLTSVPAKDRLWLVVRAKLLSDEQLHYFALFCARQCEGNSTDVRVKECNAVVKAFLRGEATEEQLYTARSAADAAESAADAAADAVARSAAYAAKSAARSAADAAAYAAYAADAAWSAAESAADAAADAAKSAARSAAEEKQCQFLAEFLQKGEDL